MDARPALLAVAVLAAGCLGGVGPLGTPTPPDVSGPVRIVAHYPAADGTYENRTVLSTADDDFASVGEIRSSGNRYRLPVTLTRPGAREFARIVEDAGFTTEGVNACDYRENPDDPGHCLFVMLEGEVVLAVGIGEETARSIQVGEFSDGPEFVFVLRNRTRARQLRAALRG